MLIFWFYLFVVYVDWRASVFFIWIKWFEDECANRRASRDDFLFYSHVVICDDICDKLKKKIGYPSTLPNCAWCLVSTSETLSHYMRNQWCRIIFDYFLICFLQKLQGPCMLCMFSFEVLCAYWGVVKALVPVRFPLFPCLERLKNFLKFFLWLRKRKHLWKTLQRWNLFCMQCVEKENWFCNSFLLRKIEFGRRFT